MKKVYKTLEEKRKKHNECSKNWVLKNPLRRKKQNAKANKNYYLKNKEKLLKVCRDWESKNPELFILQKRRHTVTRPGISLELFNELIRIQKNKCLICKTSFPEMCNPSIDHNKKCCSGRYSCGKCIRGLLCSNCNAGIGFLKDNIKILKSAILYLGGSF